jgi:tRNA-modifying protein YgfZ
MAECFSLPRDVLVVSGPDRKTWLDGLLTCAVGDVTAGKAGYGLLLTKQGKIVTDVFLLDNGSSLFVGVATGRGAIVRDLLDRYLVMEDAELVAAPASLAFYVTQRGSALGGALASGALSVAGLDVELAATSEPVPAAADATALSAVLAGHGLGVFGVDFGERDNPHEASLDRIAVSWTKGCYLGQEVVCMQDMRGKVKRRLVALAGGPELLTPANDQADVLSADGSVAGHVSSVHRAPNGAWLLASLSTSALESHGAFSVRGAPVRVVESSAPKVS